MSSTAAPRALDQEEILIRAKLRAWISPAKQKGFLTLLNKLMLVCESGTHTHLFEARREYAKQEKQKGLRKDYLNPRNREDGRFHEFDGWNGDSKYQFRTLAWFVRALRDVGATFHEDEFSTEELEKLWKLKGL